MVCSFSVRRFDMEELHDPSARAFNSEHQVSVTSTPMHFTENIY